MKAFKVGRDMAVTPGKVVFENDILQLLQYAPATEQVHQTPILFIPPWINKYYILDLNAQKSMVKWMTEQGFTVFLISWVNPDERHRDHTWESYLVEGAMTAIEKVLEETGEKTLNLSAYCIGGTLTATMLAIMAKTGDKRVKSCTFFTALTDFEDAGDLQVFVDENTLDVVDDQMDKGFLPAEAMATTFNMLRSTDLIWNYVVSNYYLGKEPFPFDLLYWNADSVAMPAKLHHYYLQRFYNDNAFSRGDLRMLNVDVTISDIKVPVYAMASKEDHIAPAAAVYRGVRMMTGARERRFVLAGSGHIAGVINPPELKKYQHWVDGDFSEGELTGWMETAEERPGSWWPDWAAWLAKKSGKMVPAREPGAVLGVVEDAPGSFVKKRFDERWGAAPPAPALKVGIGRNRLAPLGAGRGDRLAGLHHHGHPLRRPGMRRPEAHRPADRGGGDALREEARAPHRVVAGFLGDVGAQHVGLEFIGLGIGLAADRRAQRHGIAHGLIRGVAVRIGPGIRLPGLGEGRDHAQHQGARQTLLLLLFQVAGDVMRRLMAENEGHFVVVAELGQQGQGHPDFGPPVRPFALVRIRRKARIAGHADAEIAVIRARLRMLRPAEAFGHRLHPRDDLRHGRESLLRSVGRHGGLGRGLRLPDETRGRGQFGGRGLFDRVGRAAGPEEEGEAQRGPSENHLTTPFRSNFMNETLIARHGKAKRRRGAVRRPEKRKGGLAPALPAILDYFTWHTPGARPAHANHPPIRRRSAPRRPRPGTAPPPAPPCSPCRRSSPPGGRRGPSRPPPRKRRGRRSRWSRPSPSHSRHGAAQAGPRPAPSSANGRWR